MNPYGEVVAENTNGIVTVNGHSYADPALRTENTNFALLVSNKFTQPFKDSNEYGESIAKLSNMLVAEYFCSALVIWSRAEEAVKDVWKMFHKTNTGCNSGRFEFGNPKETAG